MTENYEKILKNSIVEAAKCSREKLQEAEKLKTELSKQRREARKKAKSAEKARIEAEEKARFEQGFQIDTDEAHSLWVIANQIEDFGALLSECEIDARCIMHLFKIPIQKKITDYKFAAGISYEIFAESKGQNLYFDSYVKECKRRIRNKTCERHTGLPTVKLDAHDFKMIFDTLIENGFIQEQKTRNKPPYDLVYAYSLRQNKDSNA